MIVLPIMPAKPAFRAPCNGCGICCAKEICPAGVIAFPDAVAPCPALKITEDRSRTYCKLVATEIMAGLEPIIQKALGIGEGCTMED